MWASDLNIVLHCISLTYGRRNKRASDENQLKGKGKGRVLAIALPTRELMTRSALQSRKWQLIGMS